LVIAVADPDLSKTWGGLVAAPVIGLVVGASIRRAHQWRLGWRVGAYVGSFYLARIIHEGGDALGFDRVGGSIGV
jgi:hypothetical protein